MDDIKKECKAVKDSDTLVKIIQNAEKFIGISFSLFNCRLHNYLHNQYLILQKIKEDSRYHKMLPIFDEDVHKDVTVAFEKLVTLVWPSFLGRLLTFQKQFGAGLGKDVVEKSYRILLTVKFAQLKTYAELGTNEHRYKLTKQILESFIAQMNQNAPPRQRIAIYGGLTPTTSVAVLWETTKLRLQMSNMQLGAEKMHISLAAPQATVQTMHKMVIYPSLADLTKLDAELATLGHGVIAKPSLFLGSGTGLFAQRTFSKGQYITAYAGEFISHETAVTLAQYGHDSHIATVIPRHLYIHGLSLYSEVADANQGGASFANNNITYCDTVGSGRIVRYEDKPYNAEFVIITTRENADRAAANFKGEDARLVLRALVDIFAGSEILVNGREEFPGYSEAN